MTINEALLRRITFVRLPEWPPNTRLQLPILPLEYGRGPEHGPWALLTDRVTKPTPLFIGTLLRDPEDRYEPC